MHGIDENCIIKFWSENLKEREDLSVDGSIILKCMGDCELDSFG
jgi:hypothetical protein